MIATLHILADDQCLGLAARPGCRGRAATPAGRGRGDRDRSPGPGPGPRAIMTRSLGPCEAAATAEASSRQVT